MDPDIGKDNNREDAKGKTADAKKYSNPPSKLRIWLNLHWEKVKQVGFHEWLMVAATITMAVSTTFYAKYARGQLDAMQGQSGQMRSDTRPRIGIESIQSDPIAIFANRQVYTHVITKVKNFGNYPGSIPGFVVPEIVVAEIAHGGDTVSVRLDKLMKAKLPSGHGPSQFLFPGKEAESTNGTFLNPEQVIGSGLLTAYLVGGITYTDPSGGVHHTAFSYSYQIPQVNPQGVIFTLTPGTITGVWVHHRTLAD
jgi:hypothetical protein